MKVSEFMDKDAKMRTSGQIRPRFSYRWARRTMAKLRYRKMKKATYQLM